MSKQENNKMIAEFMGARPITFTDKTKGHSFWKDEGIEGRYGAFPDGSSNYFDYDKGYHTSWDWLMPVVEKIESLGYSYDRINADVFINTQEGKNIIPNPMDGNTMTMLQKTYNAVIEFINQYNKNK